MDAHIAKKDEWVEEDSDGLSGRESFDAVLGERDDALSETNEDELDEEETGGGEARQSKTEAEATPRKPHPIYGKSYVGALQIGRGDPIAAAAETIESCLQHLRDLAGAYEMLMTKSGSKINRHEAMRAVFEDTRGKVAKEMGWLMQVITVTFESPKQVKPVLARLGTKRGVRNHVKPWHILALHELGLTASEGGALCRMNNQTYVHWLRKARIDVQRREQQALAEAGPDPYPFPKVRGCAPPPSENLQEPLPTGGTDHDAILADPVKRLRWSTAELYRAAATIQDEKVRFQYLSELADQAQREAARETERTAEHAMRLNEFVPTLVDRLERVIAQWREEVIAESGYQHVALLSVRDEAKQAIVEFHPFSEDVKAAIARL